MDKQNVLYLCSEFYKRDKESYFQELLTPIPTRGICALHYAVVRCDIKLMYNILYPEGEKNTISTLNIEEMLGYMKNRKLLKACGVIDRALFQLNNEERKNFILKTLIFFH